MNTYLYPVYVEEFRAGILGAGTGVAPLLKIEYPIADLVSATLCDVLEVVVVEGYSMKGIWARRGRARSQSSRSAGGRRPAGRCASLNL